MLELFYGTDRVAARAAFAARRDALREENPDAPFARFEPDTLTAAALEEAAAGQGVFGGAGIALCEDLLADAAAREVVLDRLPALARSPNMFLCIEERVDAETLRAVKVQTRNISHFSEKRPAQPAERRGERAFDTFALADAFAARDRKTLWVGYARARLAGIAPEEIHGTLFWQAKTIALAQSVRTAEAAGLKAFPFLKAKRAAKNFSRREILARMEELLAIYHDSRGDGPNLDLALERWVLTI